MGLFETPTSELITNVFFSASNQVHAYQLLDLGSKWNKRGLSICPNKVTLEAKIIYYFTSTQGPFILFIKCKAERKKGGFFLSILHTQSCLQSGAGLQKVVIDAAALKPAELG